MMLFVLIGEAIPPPAPTARLLPINTTARVAEARIALRDAGMPEVEVLWQTGSGYNLAPIPGLVLRAALQPEKAP